MDQVICLVPGPDCGASASSNKAWQDVHHHKVMPIGLVPAGATLAYINTSAATLSFSAIKRWALGTNWSSVVDHNHLMFKHTESHSCLEIVLSLLSYFTGWESCTDTKKNQNLATWIKIFCHICQNCWYSLTAIHDTDSLQQNLVTLAHPWASKMICKNLQCPSENNHTDPGVVLH